MRSLRRQTDYPHVTVEVIDGADHGYVDRDLTTLPDYSRLAGYSRFNASLSRPQEGSSGMRQTGVAARRRNQLSHRVVDLDALLIEPLVQSLNELVPDHERTGTVSRLEEQDEVDVRVSERGEVDERLVVVLSLFHIVPHTCGDLQRDPLDVPEIGVVADAAGDHALS